MNRLSPAPTTATRRRGLCLINPDMRMAGAVRGAPDLAPFLMLPPCCNTDPPIVRRIAASQPWPDWTTAGPAVASRPGGLAEHERSTGLGGNTAPRDDQACRRGGDLSAACLAADLPDRFGDAVERARVVAVAHSQTSSRGVDRQASTLCRLPFEGHRAGRALGGESGGLEVLELFVGVRVVDFGEPDLRGR